MKDLVEVIDGSGAFLIETNELISGRSTAGRIWKIVDFVPMDSPTPYYGSKMYHNDCVIESQDEARQKVSIQSRFLRPLANRHCPTCTCDKEVSRLDG